MHPPIRHKAGWRRRVLTLTLGVFALLITAATPVFAVDPIYQEKAGPRPGQTAAPQPQPQPQPESQRTTAPTPALTASPAPGPTRISIGSGLDVSYPQCGDQLPGTFSFAIIGVNGGRVYSPNPCLAPGNDDGDPSLLEWAGPDVQLYANTGNPGPELSSYWPEGQTTPRPCDTRTNPGNDTPECSYLYGWNAAADSYATALEAYIDLDWADAGAERIPGNPTWWLDVETANSWRLDRALNVAALQGAVDYLESMDVTEVGFYSTPLVWWWITGGTDAFADHPAWHAGARDLEHAEDHCGADGFTGGELRMVQWVEDGLDHNHRCP